MTSLFCYEGILMLIKINKLYRQKRINKQQYRTLRGQINAGDLFGVEKGINRLLQKEAYADIRN